MTIEEHVRRDCASQGLPVKLEDPTTLERVAALLTPTASEIKTRAASAQLAERVDRSSRDRGRQKAS